MILFALLLWDVIHNMLVAGEPGVSVTYKKKSGQVYDRRVAIEEVTAHFDDEVHLIEAYECSEYTRSKLHKTLDCERSCDYARKDNLCGVPTVYV